MAERVFKLEEVSPPSGVSGAMRLAAQQDFDLIVSWRLAFAAEALGEDEPNQDLEVIQKYTAQQIEAGGFYLWEDGGEPVSMTLQARPTRHGCTVTAVYTPPEHRRNGYASALVAGVSQLLLDEGYHFTTLFTDLANPTSNKIYQQIGYRPVCDFDQFKFGG
jgi:hypothetical protein